MRLTENQISAIIGIFGFIAIGTAFVVWGKMSPSTAKTPEQMRANAYYDCVRGASVNHKPISNCNDIK